MSEELNNNELLIEIRDLLSKMNSRFETKELTAESDKLIQKAENRVGHAIKQIQNSFDRIHDKLFNLNNVLIAAFFVLGTFPSDNPVISLWAAILPVVNLIFLVYLEIRQMGIYRFSSYELDWNDADRKKYGRKINSQTLLSLLSIIITLGIFSFLVISFFLK